MHMVRRFDKRGGRLFLVKRQKVRFKDGWIAGESYAM